MSLESDFDEAIDECPVCGGALEIDGTCNQCGGPKEWKSYFAEQEGDRRRDENEA